MSPTSSAKSKQKDEAVEPTPADLLREEIEAKREHLAEVEADRLGAVAKAEEDSQVKILQAESDRLDAEIANAEMLRDHQINSLDTEGMSAVHEEFSTATESIADKRARIRADKAAEKDDEAGSNAGTGNNEGGTN